MRLEIVFPMFLALGIALSSGRGEAIPRSAFPGPGPDTGSSRGGDCAGWSEQGPLSSHNPGSVHAVDDDVVWAGGGGGTVLRTTDGGENWEHVPTPAGFAYLAIAATSAMHCAVGATNGVVYQTVDGGQTWTFAGNVGSFINCMHFFDSQNGWLQADPVNGFFNLQETTDGGLTWMPSANPPAAPPGMFGLNDACGWADDQVGMFGTTQSVAFRTADGGQTWQEVQFPHYEWVNAVDLNEDGEGVVTGFITGNPPQPPFYYDRTEDFGATFVRHDSPNPSAVLFDIDAVPETDEFWMLEFDFDNDFRSGAQRSTDGALTWVQTCAFPADFAVGVLDAPTSVSAWVVGNGGDVDTPRIWKWEEGVTAVELAAFDATATADRVTLRWRTSWESSNLGYDVLRSRDGDREPTVINDSLIPGGGDGSGTYTFVDRDVERGATYDYVLEALDIDGRRARHGRQRVTVPTAPALVALRSARPNPMVASTSIAFKIADPGPVSLRIYGGGGRLLRTLVDAPLAPGQYHLDWDGRDELGREMGTGVYFYRLTAGDRAHSKKLVVVR